ncbi:hypothetical protein T265_00007 [Opisthorchis viverrini]|uniref:Integrase catalytic domain-containing protein n=1 Tax=Opisthorchis viverrini TaxID=6198 RepID=A0A075AJX0_OPIVI|nr:hypothetical protein T265_00007 [Opisthorchis viverrini]KER34119.1 hypothetical protein T265_00007 [Opisthorchis viverrini]
MATAVTGQCQEGKAEEAPCELHPLQDSWTYYLFLFKSSGLWDESLEKVATFSTIEHFWSVMLHTDPPSGIANGTDVYMFRSEIQPRWEDPKNESGGRWLLNLSSSSPIDSRISAFCKLKTMLSSDMLLTHYDPKLPIIVAADASNCGVGAAILHVFPDGSEKAIMHASKSLTPAEQRYGQIEKEALALVFAVRRFHKLLYGRRFTLLTDHKPLLSIFGSKEGVPAHSTNRLQRWALIVLGYAYWPHMDQHITDFVKRCSRCQQASKNPPHQPPVPWPRPEKPWSRIHIDHAGPIRGTFCLVLIDAFSKWREIVPVSSPTTSSTLRVLSNIFSQHGLPESIVSDNGSPFTSAEFRDFCTRHAITHVRSPPYHPQSNGQAERFVDTFKRALLKARGEETSVEALQGFLFVYRTTPNDALASHQSPAEALMGRKLRTVHSSMLPTQPTESRSIPVAVGTPFKVGTPVLVRDYRPGHDSWIAGRILRKRGSVMYDVSVGQDTWTRHQNQLRLNSTPETQVCSGTVRLDVA